VHGIMHGTDGEAANGGGGWPNTDVLVSWARLRHDGETLDVQGGGGIECLMADRNV
jgi:hypothetical protein